MSNNENEELKRVIQDFIKEFENIAWYPAEITRFNDTEYEFKLSNNGRYDNLSKDMSVRFNELQKYEGPLTSFEDFFDYQLENMQAVNFYILENNIVASKEEAEAFENNTSESSISEMMKYLQYHDFEVRYTCEYKTKSQRVPIDMSDSMKKLKSWWEDEYKKNAAAFKKLYVEMRKLDPECSVESRYLDKNPRFGEDFYVDEYDCRKIIRFYCSSDSLLLKTLKKSGWLKSNCPMFFSEGIKNIYNELISMKSSL